MRELNEINEGSPRHLAPCDILMAKSLGCWVNPRVGCSELIFAPSLLSLKNKNKNKMMVILEGEILTVRVDVVLIILC